MDKNLNAESLNKLASQHLQSGKPRRWARNRFAQEQLSIFQPPRVSSTLLVEWWLLIKDKASYFSPQVCVFCLGMGTKVIGALVCVLSCSPISQHAVRQPIWLLFLQCLVEVHFILLARPHLLALLGHSSFKTQPRKYFLSKTRPTTQTHLNTPHTTHTLTNTYTFHTQSNLIQHHTAHPPHIVTLTHTPSPLPTYINTPRQIHTQAHNTLKCQSHTHTHPTHMCAYTHILQI